MWLKDRFIIPKTDIAVFAAVLHCLVHFKSLLIHTPRSYDGKQQYHKRSQSEIIKINLP